jgi:hypothetical protein
MGPLDFTRGSHEQLMSMLDSSYNSSECLSFQVGLHGRLRRLNCECDVELTLPR